MLRRIPDFRHRAVNLEEVERQTNMQVSETNNTSKEKRYGKNERVRKVGQKELLVGLLGKPPFSLSERGEATVSRQKGFPRAAALCTWTGRYNCLCN